MSVTPTDTDELKTDPLSADELAWLKKLDRLFAQMPPRLKLIEVDDCLFAIDDDAYQDFVSVQEGGFGLIRDAGIVLADVGNGTGKINGMTF